MVCIEPRTLCTVAPRLDGGGAHSAAPEYFVSDQIAELGDVRPGDPRCRPPRLGSEVLHGLPDDHKLEEKRVVQQGGVWVSRILARLGEMLADPEGRILDVSQALAFVAAQSGSASLSTSARRRPLSMSRVATSTEIPRIS